MITLLSLLFLQAAPAQTVVCDGILGNSGEQGSALVRFAAPGASGMGVVCDRFGSLWDRAGLGQLNRYALDGRLLAQYRIPSGSGNWSDNEQITLAGDRLVLLLGGKLYTFAVDAPRGGEPTPLNVEASRISFGSKDGWIAAFHKGDLLLVNATTGVVKKAGAAKDPTWLEMGPDGAIYPVVDWKVHRVVNGKDTLETWPRSSPGERPQLLNGAWWGESWNGTIRRFNTEMQADPGVVLGGASGSFLGHLDMNTELQNGRGLARIRQGLYAVSGMGGILHLLAWDQDARQFTIVRRIGAIPYCRGLGLDREGNVWWYAGSWKWDDHPDTPLRYGVPPAEPPGIGQAVMLDNDRMVAPGWLWGKPAFYRGRLTGEVTPAQTDSTLTKDAVGTAVYKDGAGEMILLAIHPDGKGQSFRIDGEGRFVGEAGPVVLETATPVKEWTTLAMNGPDTLLGAGDGAVIEMARDGANWQETHRWKSWGNAAADRFGGKIFISSDRGRLWVSDRERHRVLVFDLKTGRRLAVFGATDHKGDGLMSLDSPEVLAARGSRAVVYDGGNQRLVKLRIKD